MTTEDPARLQRRPAVRNHPPCLALPILRPPLNLRRLKPARQTAL
jgi:hypothetical protein